MSDNISDFYQAKVVKYTRMLNALLEKKPELKPAQAILSEQISQCEDFDEIQAMLSKQMNKGVEDITTNVTILSTELKTLIKRIE